MQRGRKREGHQRQALIQRGGRGRQDSRQRREEGGERLRQAPIQRGGRGRQDSRQRREEGGERLRQALIQRGGRGRQDSRQRREQGGERERERGRQRQGSNQRRERRRLHERNPQQQIGDIPNIVDVQNENDQRQLILWMLPRVQQWDRQNNVSGWSLVFDIILDLLGVFVVVAPFVRSLHSNSILEYFDFSVAILCWIIVSIIKYRRIFRRWQRPRVNPP